MADKEVAIKINIETEAGGKSLSALKAEFKETQKTLEGLDSSSKDYIKTLEKLGGIKDQIGDLNQEIKAFNPEGKVQAFGNVIGGLASGFQAAQGAAALFGAEGEQLQKTLLKVQAASAFADGIKGVVGMGDAFKVLGNIIKANPLILIASIIIGIGAALFALKDKIAIVGLAFDTIGKTIDFVIEKFKSLTDWIGITSFASDDLAAKQIKNAQETGKTQQDNFDKQIARLKAEGKATEDVEKQKQIAILKTLELEVKALQAAAIARGSATEEDVKRITDIIKLANAAKEEIVLIEIRKNKNIEDADDESYKIRQKALADHSAHMKSIQDLLIDSWYDADQKRLADQLAAEKQAREDGLVVSQEYIDESIEMEKDAATTIIDFKQKLTKQEQEQAIDAGQNTANALVSIADSTLQFQINAAEGNEKRQNELRKKQFNLNKSAGIVNATIDGLQAVNKTIGQGGALAIPLAISVGIMALANIAKIAATKFNDSGSSSGGGGSLSSASSGVAIAPPSNSSTQLNANGTIKTPTMQQVPIVKAIVTETDITKSQQNINRIEQKAKFP